MTFKIRRSWLCVWLSCVLSALLPMAPVMLVMLPDDVRCEESDPTDASEEVEFEFDEMTLSEANSVQRRARREQSCSRRPSNDISSIRPRLDAERPSVGQASLWGRCGPLHC